MGQRPAAGTVKPESKEGGFVFRLRFVLAVLFPAVFVMLPGGWLSSTVALATAVTATIAVTLLIGVTRDPVGPATGPIRTLEISLRERAKRAAFIRLRDPNAPGRARPRAPSAGFAVT
ncbi:hypothetical protein EV191_104192 [Tamaricihabitans halophyticus]|uniref:Uncharacterized protein n=1 Tax=Tamaricihabitans halophyticus TaxID=1262583 RepID=A0A4R2R2G4_9PSEU|nr:DUF6412 domain-containing protein [Tamaricihabitans halophyticus]TCP53625.1 hypothetical protein EV191_104192 [Tamaricihabitans halophyticus]